MVGGYFLLVIKCSSWDVLCPGSAALLWQCSPLVVLLAVLAWRLLSKLGCCLFAPVSTSRLHYLRRCFISVSQFIWRVFARKQRRVLAASYLCIFYLCPDMFSVSLCVCVCIPFLLALECFFGLSVSDFSFSFLLFPLSTFTCDSLFVFLSIFGAPFSLSPLLTLPRSLSVPVTSVCHESRSKSAFYKNLLRVVPLQCRQARTRTQRATTVTPNSAPPSHLISAFSGAWLIRKPPRLRHSNRINHSLVAVFALLFPHFIYLLRLAIKFVFIFVQTLQGCDALRPDRPYFHVPNKRIKNSFSVSFSLLFLFSFPYSHFILIKKHTRVRDVGAQGTGTGTGTGTVAVTVCSNFV